MIYDKIIHANKYFGIQRNLDIALQFIMDTDLNSLPYGITEIDGDKVFVHVMDAEAKNEEDGKFEYHKKYMDIQIDIEGTEIIYLAENWDREVEAYKEDIGFVAAEKEVSCLMGSGKFVICNVKEPHMPGIKAIDNTYLKKAVIKAAAEHE